VRKAEVRVHEHAHEQDERLSWPSAEGGPRQTKLALNSVTYLRSCNLVETQCGVETYRTAQNGINY